MLTFFCCSFFPLTVRRDVDSLPLRWWGFWRVLLSTGWAGWHTAIDRELELALKSQCNQALSAACCCTVLQELKKDSSGPVKKTTELLKQQLFRCSEGLREAKAEIDTKGWSVPYAKMLWGRGDVDVAGEKGPNITVWMTSLKYLRGIRSLAGVALDSSSFKSILSYSLSFPQIQENVGNLQIK